MTYREKAKELVSQMTLKEKAGLCSGQDCWNTKSVERLGISSVMVSDGPHGLRKQIGATDNLGIGESVPAVCFPTASALACSFDRELVGEVGKAIGEECLQEEVSVILGPGVNMKRNPLCGRNFEYYSEDPVVSGELAASFINGVQSTGVGTSLKHFAVNNQERHRMTVSAVIDERTLRETYLKAFELAVKKGKPATVMCSYNRINGVYSSENRYLLTEILRKEWGYEGLVVSDWGAVHDRALGVAAGLDLEMPGCGGINDAKIMQAVNAGSLPVSALDAAATRVTELLLAGAERKQPGYRYSKEEHHDLAVRAAEESAVLLKNENQVLPGKVGQSAAVIGAFAKTPRYQGAGSSKINPVRIDTPWDALTVSGVRAEYAEGYSLRVTKPKNKKQAAEQAREQNRRLEEACRVAEGKDVVYLFAGLPEGYESEGFDRSNLKLPEEQNRLIEAVGKCGVPVVVILIGGAPMELPWITQVDAVLLAYLCGEGMGTAIANLLLGKKSPCGKLAETWPIALEDVPGNQYFPGKRLTVEHRESIFTGYRYYDTAKVPVRFPFGYGISYTKFAYSNLRTDKQRCDYGERLTVSCEVTNCGAVPAKETLFLFSAHKSKTVYLPEKELRGFTKVTLAPGETKTVVWELDTREFGYYNTLLHDWYAESGVYTLSVGANVLDCPLSVTLQLESREAPQPDFREAAPTYYHLPAKDFSVPEEEFKAIYGEPLPAGDIPLKRPYTMEHTLEDVRHTLLGRLILLVAEQLMKKECAAEEGQEGMMLATIREMPFFALVTSGDGMISEGMMEGILELLNGHYGKGIRKLLKG